MKVSVIVPVYNCEDWLRQCIDSLLCEDSPCEQEIILVDDGSTDNSGRICDEYASRYKSVRTIHTVNQGVSCARNLGLEQSLGEWIMFVDGDDVLVKNALNILYHQIQFYKYDLMRFGMYLFKKNSKKIHPYEASFSCEREEYIDLVIQRKAVLGVCGGIYKRSLFFEHKIRFTPGIRIGEDWIVLFKLLCHANSFYYYNAELYGYQMNQNSVTRNRKICSVRADALIAFNIILDYARQQQITVNPKSIYKAKSDLRRNVMKEAILNKSKSIYEETEKVLAQYADQSLWRDWFYSEKMKHKVGFLVYKILSWVYRFRWF